MRQDHHKDRGEWGTKWGGLETDEWRERGKKEVDEEYIKEEKKVGVRRTQTMNELRDKLAEEGERRWKWEENGEQAEK